MPHSDDKSTDRNIPGGPEETLGFNAALEGAVCSAAKMQLQRPWEGLQKDFAP